MLVLGIDTGSKKCGYAVFEKQGAELLYIECGVLTPPANDNAAERLWGIGFEVNTLLDSFAVGGGDLVGVEVAYVPRDRGFRGVETLAAARGVITYVCRQHGAKVRWLAPATVKKAATGSGRADKAAVAIIMTKRFGLKKEPQPDAADAMAVAVAAAGMP